jgi:hypothetical protein
MSTLAKKDINSKLQIKGFEQDYRDHNCFYYRNNGQKTNIWTKTSFGSKKEIDDGLISLMSKQVKLDKKEFMRLIQCTLSKEGYRELLIERGFIK